MRHNKPKSPSAGRKPQIELPETRQGEQTTWLPPRLTLILTHMLWRIGAAILFALAIALAAALISHHPGDPSWNSITDQKTTNWIGPAGAWISDALLQTTGLACLLIIIALLVWSGHLYRYQRKRRWILRIFAMLASVILTTPIFTTINLPSTLFAWNIGPWPYPAGGAIGLFLGQQIIALLNSAGLPPASIETAAKGIVAALSLPLFMASLGCERQTWLYPFRLAANCTRRSFHWMRSKMIRLSQANPEANLHIQPSAAPSRLDDHTINTRKNRGLFSNLLAAIRNLVIRQPHDHDDVLASTVTTAPIAPNRPIAQRIRMRQAPTATVKIDTSHHAQIPIDAPAGVNIISGQIQKHDSRSGRSNGDGSYLFPSLDYLHSRGEGVSDQHDLLPDLQAKAAILETVLRDFGVQGEIVKIRPGPVVTLYELEPAPGTKTNRVIGLSDDIARSMSAISVRIATIPGRSVIGIELPNQTRNIVDLKELLQSEPFTSDRYKLPLVLGKNIGGQAVIADLSTMPHLLIAGTTGSGKSVGLNAMILSLLYKYRPEECRFIMIDPKMLELSVYEGIPHLLTPVVTEPKKAITALKWAVREMEERYRAMSALGVRNIEGYNQRVHEALAGGRELSRRVQTGFDDEGQPVHDTRTITPRHFPLIVLVVDEMADLMLVAGKDIEASIQRLAQMARAAGIHLVMATQRPSVDVITGTIKANFPTRISFQVTSKIDSRTILGEQGAEQLLGKGDMLYMAGGGRIIRVHGPFVDDREVEVICNHVRSQGTPEYIEAITDETTAHEQNDPAELGG
ncbi:MAG: DNA translocase FtsK, partial [Pseudomonadota bacterium]